MARNGATETAVAACIVLYAALGCGSAPTVASDAAPPPSRPTAEVPHAKLIQCPSHSLGATIELGADGTHYAGFGRDNYEGATYRACTYSPREIRCEGEWEHTHSRSMLVITAAPDGRLSGHLTLAQGTVTILECVAPDHDLGPCVFNPGTSTCTEAPWNQRH